MCGICGFNRQDSDLVARMIRTMKHRGPDQSGSFLSPTMTLGHTRLSIIDLSENGRQPMTNETGTVQLVFNGEIYNFQELRRELEGKGHVFKSNADSEAIVHAYEEYGLDATSRLRGMFAFAVWDTARQRLFLARDRIGIKPLYYHAANGRISFASEIKALLEDPSIERKLDRQSLYNYIGFEFVPAPGTMFEGISKLPAGCTLVFENGNIAVKRYWDPAMGGPQCSISRADAVEQLRAHLDFAVKSHLISDVPLGVFLSGGLDSSTLVAMMRRHISGPLRTFTIGYHDKTFSELDYAKQVADVFQTEHHVLMIDDLTPAYVEQVLWHLDEPMTDLSTVPLYLVCRQAREHVTVCLSGEGGDESFAGYDRFKASRINRAYSKLPAFMRKAVSASASSLADRPQKKGFVNMLKRFIEGSDLPPAARHLRWQYFSNRKQDEMLFNPACLSGVNPDPFYMIEEYAQRCTADDTVNREIFLDMRFMMTDSVLMKVDKMSMASSMEIRVPLLDHVVVEFVASLPGDWKLSGLTTKKILRSALEGILPANIVNRGKQGYSLPVKHLLRNRLRQYMIDLLNGSNIIRDTMNVNYINRMIDEHVNMRHNHNHVLWALINVAIWGNRFLGGKQRE